jgi:xanthine permease XanP
MAHVEAHAAEGTVVARPKLLYGLNDKPPVKDAIFVALQHVCAIFIRLLLRGC